MQRGWKTHDLVDLFEATRLGRLPCPFKRFSNYGIADDPPWKIVKLDINWPYQSHYTPEPPMDFKVEDNVPIPPINRLHDSPLWIEPLDKLTPGQSLYVNCTHEELRKLRPRALAHCYDHHKGWLMVTRRVYKDGSKDVIGLRIWRVE